jgi:hypothetical protein
MIVPMLYQEGEKPIEVILFVCLGNPGLPALNAVHVCRVRCCLGVSIVTSTREKYGKHQACDKDRPGEELLACRCDFHGILLDFCSFRFLLID